MKIPQPARAVIFYLVALAVLSLVQVSLPDRTLGVVGKSDLLLVLTVLAGFLFGPVEGAGVGLTAGFLRDAFASGTIGSGMLLGMYSGILSGILFRRLFRKGFFAAMLQVVLVTTAALLLVEVAGILFETDVVFTLSEWAKAFFGRTLPVQLALNAAAALPLFLVLHYAGPRSRIVKGISAADAATVPWR